ncbi:heparan-alpha-glucosaminide N-acetyltransferase domain-containing protein [Microbacterium sp. X-17]|uniref:heparan-alpha-glucosaminide N-acetyltransferase domain-containing protein n=1 Tax=Microbacterium sp. X-17 TaxID=3144404 RepID=UPI0031F55FCB
MAVSSDVSPERDAAAGGPATGRILSVDRFRGALVILMVGGNYLGGVGFVPSWLKHAPDIGLTVADLVAPAFVFAIGLSYGPSFARRARFGLGVAYRHFLTRYLALIGIGAILTAGGTAVAGQPTDWGVLQAIGVAGLICLVVIRFGTVVRFAAGAVLLVVFQLILEAGAVPVVHASVQGGFVGALSWGALLILSTAVADVWRRGLLPLLLCSGILTVVAVVSVFVVPVAKTRVSLSYVLVTLAVASIAFLLTDAAARALPRRAGLVSWWGEYPLVLYLLHLLLLALVVLPDAPWWYADAPPWLAAAQLAVILVVLSWVAWLLHRGRARVRL